MYRTRRKLDAQREPNKCRRLEVDTCKKRARSHEPQEECIRIDTSVIRKDTGGRKSAVSRTLPEWAGCVGWHRKKDTVRI